ncbi:LysR substrate-binding domain-containing protein [Mycetohabitans sp. B2]|uniref:LysR substrate-binding domain-containing protein n=1 Tax=Mycetohabitans sp. B2 TaxID=2841274 RepID=UPI003FA5C20B
MSAAPLSNQRLEYRAQRVGQSVRRGSADNTGSRCPTRLRGSIPSSFEMRERAAYCIGFETPPGRAVHRLPHADDATGRRACGQWPDVTLELATGTTGCLINRLREFDIDVALIATPVDGVSHLTDTFELTPVYREELVLIAARDHPPIRQPRDVRVATLIAFESGCAYRAYAERWYAHDALRPRRALELGSYHAIVACVAAGAGIAVTPRSVLELQRAGGREIGISMHPLPDIGMIGHAARMAVRVHVIRSPGAAADSAG